VVDCGYDDVRTRVLYEKMCLTITCTLQIVVCTKEEREQRWKDDRQRIKDAARDVMSDYESSDEEEASIGRLEFPEDGDDDDDDA
jgi:ABC-type xylose transport system substrate-binding protein